MFPKLTCFLFKCSPQVRVPKERIAMYREFIIRPNKYKDYLEGLHKVSGPFDIALIKLRESVTLIPGRLVPVGLLLKLNTACAIVQACLGNIKDKEVSGEVQGFSQINAIASLAFTLNNFFLSI